MNRLRKYLAENNQADIEKLLGTDIYEKNVRVQNKQELKVIHPFLMIFYCRLNSSLLHSFSTS